jgi:lysophospholipase L1-like esterase
MKKNHTEFSSGLTPRSTALTIVTQRVLSRICCIATLCFCLLIPLLGDITPLHATQAPLRLVIIGDSTVCEYPPEQDCRGWGQYIQGYFKDTVKVINLARSGRSTKTFINEGLWNKTLEAKPDILLIQFGHNDSHSPDKPESTDAKTDFREYLRQYIDQTRAIGGKPILVTPVQRRTYSSKGKLDNSLIIYANAMKAVAAQKNVSVIDLNASSGNLYEQLGTAANDIVANAPQDRTHFNEKGARMMAHLVMQELTLLEPHLKKQLAPEKPAALGKIAAKPLFRDPVFDGAADPVLCWNSKEGKWFMFYTNRRANEPNTQGVSWVHGTHIGIAESSDYGATWKYRTTANIDYARGEYSYWAPEVIEHNGTYHMYLTYVPGIFTNWDAPRDIIHLTSSDLLNWKYRSTLKLSSSKVIDACVMRLPDGTWRLWYNNEVDRKSIYYADSPDLYKWEDHGKVIGDRPGEGPKVFRWKDRYWMVVDVWNGLGVYFSDDCVKWTRQKNNLLDKPGKGADDKVKGGHPDVVVSNDRAFLFYFTHPGRQKSTPKNNPYEQRRSSIQVVELEYKDGQLSCDRDKPTYILLQ